MRRTLKFSLNQANAEKKESLRKLLDSYRKGVNCYLATLSKENRYILSNKEVEKGIDFLGYAYKQCAYNKAVKIWKSWRRNRNKGELPIYQGCIDLDSRFIKVEKAKNLSFDYCVRISTLERGKRTIIPFKSYEYANRYFDNWRLCKGGKVQFRNGNIFLILTFEKETPVKKQDGETIAVDVGIKKLMVDSNGSQYGEEIEAKMDKIQRKKQGSKAFEHALRERDQYVNRIAVKLPFQDIKTIVVETLKGIKQNTRREKRFGKKFRSKFQRWVYAKLLGRIKQLSEVFGVQYLEVAPAYTSQTCPECRLVHTSNRKNEVFRCRRCDYSADADYVGARNILTAYLASVSNAPMKTNVDGVQL